MVKRESSYKEISSRLKGRHNKNHYTYLYKELFQKLLLLVKTVMKSF